MAWSTASLRPSRAVNGVMRQSGLQLAKQGKKPNLRHDGKVITLAGDLRLQPRSKKMVGGADCLRSAHGDPRGGAGGPA